MKESSEESEKKEDLGADKEDHTYTHPSLHLAGVLALKSGFPGNIPPSLDYSGKDEPYPRPH